MGLLTKVNTAYSFYQAVGADTFPCMVDRLIGKQKLRLISVAGSPVYIRTNTPDLFVALSGLVYKEYDDIRCVNPGNIIDAGANIGTSAIFFAKKYPKARIFAIEPEDDNFDILLMNTKKYKNVIPIKAALWSGTGRKMIKNLFTGPWGYTISDTHNKAEETGQQIDCITIESLMNDYGLHDIDLLKMDIEGGEKDVLENSSSWIGAVDIITAELHDRICLGCDRAFYLATKDFQRLEKNGEKITAYRT